MFKMKITSHCFTTLSVTVLYKGFVKKFKFYMFFDGCYGICDHGDKLLAIFQLPFSSNPSFPLKRLSLKETLLKMTYRDYKALKSALNIYLTMIFNHNKLLALPAPARPCRATVIYSTSCGFELPQGEIMFLPHAFPYFISRTNAQNRIVELSSSNPVYLEVNSLLLC